MHFSDQVQSRHLISTFRWSPQEDVDLVDGVAADLKQQLVNPLIQRMQLIREKLNNIVDAEEIKSLHEKRKETQDELDRIEELEDLEDLIVGALPFDYCLG